MTKKTTTINEIITADLNEKGHNEFLACNQLDLVGGTLNYMYKITQYDEDVQDTVNRIIFRGYKLPDTKMDIFFKKMFVNKFMNRQIIEQTLESFSNNLIYNCMSHEHYLISLLKNMEDYLTNGNTVDSSRTHDNRTAIAQLPQSEVNVNVDNTILDYADNNTISRDKDINHQESENYDLDTLIKSFPLIDNYFKMLDKRCFLQVW